jgi:hypothetical protein
MATREIPRNEWREFFDGFSRRHQGWLVTMEVLGADIGAQVEARELPLVGVTAEVSHEGEGQIAIIVGDGPQAHVTHTISGPAHVRLKESAAGADEALEIESTDSTMTLVRFRSAMPPEMVDGI